MPVLAYRKHYPAGATRAQATRHLLAVVRRAPGRRTRWQRQAQRRRPWLLRPLTVGEQTLFHCKALARELADLLLPFRRTRLQGHEELYGLLCDADTRPTVVAQVQQLSVYLDRVRPHQHQQGQQIARWREEWAKATPAIRQRLTHVDKALAINGYYIGLNLLLTEAQQDIDTIKLLCPPAFVAATTPAPWLSTSPPNQPAGPTPYSS